MEINRPIKRRAAYKKTIVDANNMILSYNDFIKTMPNLKGMKAPVLKSIAKQYKLHITGNKGVLIERIETFFKRIGKIIRIQSLIRRYLVKQMFKLRGPALRNRNICNNSSDFFTLEPMSDVPSDQFYSYKDSNEFVYGFNVYSLVTLWRKKGKIVNPYNRQHIGSGRLSDILKLVRLMHIYFPDAVDENDRENTSNVAPPLTLPRAVVQNVVHNINQNNINQNNINQNNIIQNSIGYINLNNNELINDLSPDSIRIYGRLNNEIRIKPLNARIQDAFMEMDQLGNYTNSSWFSNLEKHQCSQFFFYLRGVWYYRGLLSGETRRRICPIDPFTNIFNNNIVHIRNLNNLETDVVRRGCITLIENMIYPGVDIEFRRLGAMHVLRALTLVSVPARNSMMWLYESIE